MASESGMSFFNTGFLDNNYPVITNVGGILVAGNQWSGEPCIGSGVCTGLFQWYLRQAP